MLYRVATDGDLAFGAELLKLGGRRGIDVRFLVGTEIGDDRTDQLGTHALRTHIPDIADRDVYVCGPPAMIDAVRARLVALRVPEDRVHFERFEY